MIHAVQLRHGLVGFVDEHLIVAWKIIEQRGWRLAGQAAGEMAGVIFDPVAVSDRLDHFQVIHRALVHALRFHHSALLFQFRFPPGQLFANGLNRAGSGFRLHNIMSLRIDRQAHIFLLHCAKQRIDLRERLDFVSPEFHAVGHVVVSGKNLDYVSAHTVRSAAELAVGTLVENFNELAGDVLALDLLALFQEQQHSVIGFRRAQAVDAAHRSDNQAVAAFEKRLRCRKPKLIELVIDGRFFFDIKVSGGNVSFRLVVIIVRDEIFDGIAWEKAFELVIKLGCQSLVVRHDQRRAIHRLDHFRHGVRLARSCDT